MASAYWCEPGVELPGEVIVTAVVQEEPTEGMAMRVLVEEEGITPDWVVLGEPTNLQLARGQRGRMEMHVSTFGRSCHASSPEQGENALYEAARLIFGLEMLNANLMTDAVLGKGTLAVTQLRTMAGSRNAIPDRCDLVIDRRLTLGETASRALTEVETAMQREGVRGAGRDRRIIAAPATPATRPTAPKSIPPGCCRRIILCSASAPRRWNDSLGYRPASCVWAFLYRRRLHNGRSGHPHHRLRPRRSGPGPHRRRIHPPGDVQRAAETYAALVIDLLNHLASSK